MRTVLIAALVLVTAGCTAQPPPPAPPPSASPSVATPAPAAVRGCETATSIGGALDASQRPGPGEIAILPLDYTFGHRIDEFRDPDPGGYYRFKLPVRLRAGAQATVSIPAAYRDRAKLTYFDGSDHTVTFVACGTPDGTTRSDFAGGFAVREPVCLPLDVTSAGKSTRLRLEFGADVC